MSIRDSLNTDIGGIGRKVERPEPQKPAILQPIPGNSHIVRNADGKLETAIPENEWANQIPHLYMVFGDPVVITAGDMVNGTLRFR